MAGIGFELRKLMAPGTFTAYGRAYTYAAIVGSGPWLLSVVGLGVLGALAVDPTDFVTRQTFASTVVYVFGGTLVLTGPLQIIVTRYLADLVYRGARDRISATYLPVVTVTAALLLAVGVPFFGGLDTSLFYRLVALSLFVTIGCTWLVMVFLTAGSEYRAVVRTFLWGTALSVGGGLLGGRTAGLEGYLAGYAAGQFAIFLNLSRLVLRHFGHPSSWDAGFLGYARRYPSLLAIGLALNLGVWVDKFVFWGSAEAGTVAGRLATLPAYDSSMFIGLLTVLPALAHFFLVVETDLAGVIAAYYDAIFFKRPLAAIREARATLEVALRRALLDILRVQAIVTGLCVYFAGELLVALGLPYGQLGMFRYACVGSLFFCFVLFSVVVLLYLDRRGDALAVVALFCGLNAVLTPATLALGFAFWGVGFAGAGGVALVLALQLLFDRVRRLEYLTFAGTPIEGQRRPSRGLRAGPGRGFGLEHPL